MPTPMELEQKFWKSLKSDMTMMLGIADHDDGHTRPMAAQVEGEHGPIWFFTSTENSLAKAVVAGNARAIATFSSKGNDLYACVHGRLSSDSDPAVIDRLWNRHVAAWYEGGREDPKIVLLRLDPEHAEIWEDASTLYAGIKMMFGGDPKRKAEEKHAEVSLG